MGNDLLQLHLRSRHHAAKRKYIPPSARRLHGSYFLRSPDQCVTIERSLKNSEEIVFNMIFNSSC